jgi:hypothetical protein
MVIKEIDETNVPRKRRVYRFATYEVRRHLLNLDGIYFKVAYGIPNCDPTILSGYCTADGQPLAGERNQPEPSGARIAIVPRIYEEHYQRNCRAALQDFSGISTERHPPGVSPDGPFSGVHRTLPSGRIVRADSAWGYKDPSYHGG